MAEQGRIDVYFHNANNDGTSNESPEEVSQGEDASSLTTPKESGNSTSRSAIVSVAIQATKQLASYGLSVYGDLTGDYLQQKEINSLIQFGSTALMMAQFPVGTVAGTVQLATGISSSIIANNKANRAASLLASRCGNETINNSEVDR